MAGRYSKHGWERFQDKFVIYHQGGLDAYCQLYAIFNLINFLHFKLTLNKDFVGRNNFEQFLSICDFQAFNQEFPKTPFGGDEGIRVMAVLDIALRQAGLEAETRIEEDETIPLEDAGQQPLWIRIGAEEAFDPPQDVLCLAQVHEDEDDLEIGHCVVLIGKDHLQNTTISVPNGFDGVVLDSDRDYAYWRYDTEVSRLEIACSDENPKPFYWVSSFVSCSEYGLLQNEL